MGRAGRGLRVVSAGAGAGFDGYALPPGAPATAAGQFAAGALRSRYRRWGRRLDSPAPVFGVLGHPVGQSLSPPMFEAAFAHLGIDAAYHAFAVPPAELEEFLSAARLMDIAGLNVTIPHKEAVLPLLDDLDAEARAIGAVNTIVPMDGRLLGANTDWSGAMQAVETRTGPLAGSRVSVIGAGGSARAVVYGLTRRRAEPVIYARNEARAAAIANAFGARHEPLAELAHAAGDVLVNATPVGMGDPEASPAPRAAVRAHRVVFDLVFHPHRTRLLRDAETEGRETVFGLDMLVRQAAAAFPDGPGSRRRRPRWRAPPGRPTMPGSSLGQVFRVTAFGESHGPAIGVVVDGCPPRIRVAEADIQRDLDRRRPGQSRLVTPRNEPDRVEILSGVHEGRTTGHPVVECSSATATRGLRTTTRSARPIGRGTPTSRSPPATGSGIPEAAAVLRRGSRRRTWPPERSPACFCRRSGFG